MFKICWKMNVLAQGLQFEQFWERSSRRSYRSNIKDLGILVSVKKIFKRFPYVRLCKTCWPLGGATFGSRAIICTILLEVL